MTSETTTNELLDAIDRFNENRDSAGIEDLLAQYAHRADIEAIRAWADEHRLQQAFVDDLEGQGWWPVNKAASKLPYKAVTIRRFIEKGQLGREGIDWVKQDTWPYRLYISAKAFSWLSQRDYKASGPRGPRKATT